MTRPRVAVRTDRHGAALHMGVLVGRRYETACYREIPVPRAVVYEGRDRLLRRRADVAWKYERRCADCEARLARLGAPAIAAERGW